MKKAIEKVGAEKVFLVVIDGGSDWSATETMIQEFFPWISFLHCVSHECSLIIKDCFKEDGDIPELYELNKWITEAQHWFASHTLTSMRMDMKQPGEKTGFVWPAVTRYGGLLLKIKRFLSMKDLLRRIVNSGVYTEKNFTEDPFKDHILGADKWSLMERVTDTMGPLLLLIRLADGQKPVISKLHGTQLYVRSKLEQSAVRAGADSVESKILRVFLTRWGEMQSDIVGATYMLDPLFVDKSRTSIDCTTKLWDLARKVLQLTDDADWTPMHRTLVSQLSKFQGKGTGLQHMSSPAAWIDLHEKCALTWWLEWGIEVPDLQQLAIKLVSLMIGSGPAERTWKDVGNVLTKNRNRLGVQKCLDLVYVRMWLRRELKLVTDEELEQFKDWETVLLREASDYAADPDPDSGEDSEVRVFNDQFENWEQDAIDGKGPGPNIPLGVVRRNRGAQFRLQEKYKDLFLVDKDSRDENDYYGGGGGPPLPKEQWEHRKIIGLVWQARKGWRVETKMCQDLTGPSENYIIEPVLIRMIKESPFNSSIRFRSEVVDV